MKILRVIATVDPTSGGPVAGLRAVTPALAKLGHSSDFLTLDPPNAEYLKTFVAPVHSVGPAKGSFAYSGKTEPWLERSMRNYDAVIVHGLWQHLGPVVRKISRQRKGPPYFVFPHGMLDPSLSQAYPLKHFKKYFYWLSVERFVERDARAVFFTCEEERRLARTTFPLYSCSECVVDYGCAEPEGSALDWRAAWQEKCPQLAGLPYWIFLGRLHSKKGVELLLNAYASLHRQLDAKGSAGLPALVLAGPCAEPAYLASLKSLAKEGGIAAKVLWPGMLGGAAKWGALANADVFILPSYQENFGIAVAEALAVGTPVLLSDRVNIWREIAGAEAALVEPPTEAGVMRLLQRWLALDAPARASMRSAARSCFEQHYEITHAAETLAEKLSVLIRRSD